MLSHNAAGAVDEVQLVSFEVAGQEYALSIEHVQEIVQMPASIAAVPRADPHVLGIMTLREKLLPLVSLRAMLGLPPASADDRNKIVVVALPGGAAAAQRCSRPRPCSAPKRSPAHSRMSRKMRQRRMR